MKKQKLLVQVQGSAGDPAYDAQMVAVNGENIPFLEYFHKNGIKTLDRTLVASCHGNTKLTLDYAEDMQKLADEGHRIAAVCQGGLYFALPSIIAANAPTVPVISIPLDARSCSYGGLDAFLAPQVPSGTAAMGGVEVGAYGSAAKVAKEVLTNEFKGVYLFNSSNKLNKKLEEFGIPILGEADTSLTSGLVVGCLDADAYEEGKFNDIMDGAARNVGIFAPLGTANPERAITLMGFFPEGRSVYVRGEDNLAFFAAKIVSAYNEKARDALKESAEKKAKSYEKREINLDSFVGGK